MALAPWIQRWLSGHPLKAPTRLDRAQYTAQVMARVRALAPPPTWPVASGAVQRWVQRWRLGRQVRFRAAKLVGGFATAAVAAAVFVVVGRLEQPSSPIAQLVEREAEVLAAVEESDVLAELTDADDLEVLAQDLEAMDILVLAEAESSDEQWLEETLQLFDEVGEDVTEETAGDAGDDEWLDELELLDETELSTTS